MGLFTRRPKTEPPQGLALGAPSIGAVVSASPILPAPPSSAGINGTAGWAALPHISPQAQIGAYGGRLLNRFPANLPGVQLHSGREWLQCGTGWYYPSLVPLPNGSIQQTQQLTNLPGAQRYGALFSGPIGPITAQRNAALVTVAQIRQSGAAALQFARNLNPGSSSSSSNPQQ